jgi:hypothetical protein
MDVERLGKNKKQETSGALSLEKAYALALKMDAVSSSEMPVSRIEIQHCRCVQAEDPVACFHLHGRAMD